MCCPPSGLPSCVLKETEKSYRTLKHIVFTAKTELLFWGVLTSFGRENQAGVVRYVNWLFLKIDQYLAISFEWYRRELSIDVAKHTSILKSKGVVRILVIKKDQYSAISFEWSRRELSIDVAEHRSILKRKGVVRILVIY